MHYYTIFRTELTLRLPKLEHHTVRTDSDEDQLSLDVDSLLADDVTLPGGVFLI